MSPFNKARELVDLMESIQTKGIRGYNFDIARSSALICVDEILSIEGNYLISTDYWREVKQEINQL